MRGQILLPASRAHPRLKSGGFGEKGAESAKEDADKAIVAADEEKQNATASEEKVKTLLKEADPELVARLDAKYPGVFGL